MIATPRARGWGTVAARTIVTAALAAVATRAAGADDAPAPAWLRAPLDRGPLAGTVAVDARRMWWGVDGVVPLGVMRGLRAPLDRAPRLALGLSIAGDENADMRNLGYTALLDRRATRAGEWLGLSTGRGGQAAAPLHFGTGAWHSFKPVQIEAGVVTSVIPMRLSQTEHWLTYHDTTSWDSTTFRAVDQTAIQTSAQSALRWQFGRLEVAAVGGVMLSGMGAPQRWAQATVNVRASRQLMVLAAFGQRPAPSLAFDSSAQPRTMLGVQLAPWPARDVVIARGETPQVRRWMSWSLPEGRTAVRVRCPGATRVELTGDVTDWAPLTLVAMGGGWWGGDMAMPAGLHQVQVRVDGGAWHAPPGLPTTQGDFAGTAGVLVVE